MSVHLSFDEATDRDLEGRIRGFLARSGRQCLQSLNVRARNGSVQIKGHVCCFHERQLAISCCQRVAGVIEIEDHIEVDA